MRLVVVTIILGLAGTAWYQGRNIRLLREELLLQRRVRARYS